MCALQTGVTSDSADRFLIGPGKVYYGSGGFSYDTPGNLLGATQGGNEFDPGIEMYEHEVDGAMGPVKGMRKIQTIAPTLTVNLVEQTTSNWLKALPGATSSDEAPTETLDDVGEGDDSTVTFALPTISTEGVLYQDTLRVYLDGTEQTRGATEDYTYDDSTQEITFNSTPGTDATINAQYIYDNSGSTGVDHNVITFDQLVDSDYIDYLAIFAEISDPSKTNDGIFLLKNGLSDGSFDVSLPGESENETVITLTFEGHFDPSVGMDLANSPVEIWYPAA